MAHLRSPSLLDCLLRLAGGVLVLFDGVPVSRSGLCAALCVRVQWLYRVEWSSQWYFLGRVGGWDACMCTYIYIYVCVCIYTVCICIHTYTLLVGLKFGYVANSSSNLEHLP